MSARKSTKTKAKPTPTPQRRRFVADLGDTDAEDTVHSEEFRSPQTQDGTDYGLEFTQTPRRGRQSTLLATRKSPRISNNDKQNVSDDEESSSSSSLSSSSSSKENDNIQTDRLRNLHLQDTERRRAQRQILMDPNQPSTSRAAAKARNMPVVSKATSRTTSVVATATPRTTNATVTTARTIAAGPQPSAGGRRQPRKKRPQKRILNEIRYFQNTTELLIPRLAFARIVREIMQSCNPQITHVTKLALEALQVATETYVTQRIEDAYLISMHAKRITLFVQDLQLIAYLRRNDDKI